MYSTAAGANRIHWGDVAMMDTPAAYTIGLDLYLNTVAASSLFTKYDHGAEPWKGWRLLIGGDDKLYINHGNGVGANIEVGSTGTLSATTFHRIMMSWDGSNADFYIDGAASGTPAFSQGLTANSQTVCWGSDDGGTSNSVNGRGGHIMWWDVALTASEAAMHYAGMIPRPTSLKFWAPGWSDPGQELIGQLSAAKAGTVTIAEDLAKTTPYFFGECTRRLPSILYVYKVINETEGLTDTSNLGIVFPYKVISETMGLTESTTRVTKPQKVIDETMGVLDYDEEGSGKISPDGTLIETMSDGTVWTRVFPPFARKTYWTED